MQFILPTQHAPHEATRVGELKISSNKRVKVPQTFGVLYRDSMIIESPEGAWDLISEWLTFHSFIFDDHVSLDWYESQEDLYTNTLATEGECSSLINYSDISNRVYYPDLYPATLDYRDLYTKYISQSKETKALVRNYFNSTGITRCVPTQRIIRNDSFLRILVSFSIVELLMGEMPKCPCDLSCSIHGKIEGHKHNQLSQRDWIQQRLLEITSDPEVVSTYFQVIWEVRQKIRHKTVHEGSVSEASFVQQPEGEIIWDWAKTSAEWDTNSIALWNLETQIKQIARNLLLNKIFNLQLFPKLRPMHSVRIAIGKKEL